MKRIAAFVCLGMLCAAPAFPWSMTLQAGQTKYVCRQLGNDLECRVNGKVVGWVKKLGGDIVYTDNRNNRLGTAHPLGNTWQFKGPNGAIIGTAKPEGNNVVYKSGNGRVIGYAKPEGIKTAYTDGSNRSLGSADTNTMPLRPLPFEEWLKSGGE